VSVQESPPVDALTPREPLEKAAVRVRGVSKAFAVPRHRAWTLKERLRHPRAVLRHDRLEALRDVSFHVAPGEFFAVIGANGSGKSTLLRCIAGIYQPDGGEIEVSGRLAPFIELGVGFHPVLDARDNVTLAGTLMGLRPAEARRRVPQVIGFAELEEFADMKLANFSSGMQARLGFSTSIQVDADVLLFDEVLAVGDAVFRAKSFDTFERLVSQGRTIVYVSHSLDTIKRFADRVLLLEHGRAVAIGEPGAVLDQYERRNREHRPRSAPMLTKPVRGDEIVSGAGARPSAASAARRFAEVTLALARADFKLRYLDSAVGYVWSLAQPLLLFGVLYMVFSQVVRFDTGVTDYPLKLLLGIVLFTYFTEAAGSALPSLVTKGSMLRKIRFPALAVPLSSVLTSSFVYGFSLLVLVAFLLASGDPPSLAWLEVIPLLALLVVFTAAVSVLLALLYVSIRDVQPIWVVVTRLLFFATPIFYPIELAPEHLQRVLMLNPLGVVIVEARHALIDPSGPSAASAAGGPVWLAIPLVLTGLVAIASAWLLHARGSRIAERM
jgi:ABC-type polysaccharide/polyol phosphate transport system ATPase subunit/ABC-type polysaccharide/polyol phosphate export permease